MQGLTTQRRQGAGEQPESSAQSAGPPSSQSVPLPRRWTFASEAVCGAAADRGVDRKELGARLAVAN